MSKASTAGSDLRALVAALSAFSAPSARTHLVLTIALSAVEGVGLVLMVPLLQLIGVEGGQAITGAPFIERIFAFIGLRPTLPTVLVFYVTVVAVQSVLRRQRRVQGVVVQQSLALGLRRRVYAAIVRTEWTFLAGQRSSDAVHVLTAEIDRVTGAAAQLLDIVAASITTAVIVALALRVSSAMTVAILILGAALALAVRQPMARSRAAGKRVSQASSDFYAAMSEHLAGMKLAKGYGAEARHAEIFDAMADRVSRETIATNVEYARLQEQFSMGSAALLAAIVYVSYAVLRIPTASLLFLLFLFYRLVPRLTSLYERWQELAGALPALNAVTTIETQCNLAARPTSDRRDAIAFRRRLTFERVTFTYPNTDTPAVDDVSLSIGVGSTIAIVGPSGSGKSTLGDLMMGLLTPSAGRIVVDDTPLGATTWTAWRAQLGFVPQESFLFHDTVRANLTWASLGASDEDLFEALRLAAADEFVRGLPHGLDTNVGDRGVLVSGGERQRLSLARALVRRPGLLILDEATSALDAENETRICQALERLRQRLTIVIISHRLSMVRSADTIYVMDRGRIVESGTWTDLVARKDGRFRALCLAQPTEHDDVQMAWSAEP